MTDTHSLAYRALDRHVIHGRADELAFAGAGRSMTYAQLLHDSACIAGALRDIGVTADTTVSIDITSRREHAIVLLACARLGVDLDEGALFSIAGEPPVLTTPVTEVPWDVLLRAGRVDPAPAPDADPDGYEQRLAALHGEVLATLIAGDTLT